MLTKAKALGRSILEKERELDAHFAKGKITEERVRRLVAEIARMQGEVTSRASENTFGDDAGPGSREIKRYTELSRHKKSSAERKRHERRSIERGGPT